MPPYRPIQFNNYTHYQEIFPCRALDGKVVCFWELKALKTDVDYFVIPDGCVDIVVNCGKENEVFLSPTLIKPDIFQLSAEETWFGIRLSPAMASQLFSIHLAELKHQAIELADIHQTWSRILEEQFAANMPFENRVKIAEQLLISSPLLTKNHLDNRLNNFIQAIYESHGNIPIAEAKQSFVSTRHIRRLFHHHIGVSPKKFARIVRSQHYIKALTTHHQPNSFYDNYFDQAHFIKEIKEMTGLTPKQLMEKFKQKSK